MNTHEMFNGQMYFLGAIYYTSGGFSHLPNFLARFANELNSLPYKRAPVLEKVIQLREEFTHITGTISEKEALRLMLAEDLVAIESVLWNDDIASSIDRQWQIETMLRDCKDEAIHLLEDLGVRVNSPQIFIVNELPSPFNRKGYSAASQDEGDYIRRGVQPGLYFPQRRLRPFYSPYLLMHELIHTILGERSPNILTSNLEEGVAELLGGIYLSSKILGKEITKNLFIYNRLGYGYQQFWELYMDATRQATLLYHRFGLQGILALVNEGREKLNQIEEYCLYMKFDKIDLPQGGWIADLSELVDFLSLAYPRNLVVSPLAKYLSRYVRPHQSAAELLSEVRVDSTAGKKALYELQNRVSLISLSEDGQVIDLSDCEHLGHGAVIRYELSEKPWE